MNETASPPTTSSAMSPAAPPLPPPLPAAPAKRRGRGCCGCVTMLGALAVLAGAWAWLLASGVDPAEWARERWERGFAQLRSTAASRDPWALPPMPPQVVTHPDGVRFEVPEGALAEIARVAITAREDAPAAEPFERTGPAYDFDAVTLAPGRRPATVDLPSGAAGDHAVVLYYAVGTWIRIPSEPVRLADGSPGRRVRMDGVPFPWQLTVAAAPPGGGTGELATGDRFATRLARLEQLRVSDRAAYLAELQRIAALDAAERRRAEAAARPFPLLPAAYASGAPDTSTHAFTHLERAQWAFHLADACLQGGGRDYLEGLRHLWKARQSMVTHGIDAERKVDDRLDREADGNPAVYGGSLPLRDMIEYYMGTFAPWGVELMIGLLEDEGGWYAPHFDVQVLPRYGHLDFLNMPLPGGEQPIPMLATNGLYPVQYIVQLEEAQRGLAKALGLIESEAMSTTLLTLYSPRIQQVTTDELLSKAKEAKSGVSALMGLALLVKGAPGAGVAASIWVAYKITAPLVEYYLIDPKAKAIEREGGLTKSQSLSIYKAGKMVGNLLFDPKKGGVVGKVKDELTDIVLNYLIDYEEIAKVEELRAMGGSHGYRDTSAWQWPYRALQRFPIPPLLVKSTVYGPTDVRPHPASATNAPGPEGAYETRAKGQVELSLNYAHLSANTYRLSEDYRANKPAEISTRLDARLRAQTPYGVHLRLERRGGSPWLHPAHFDSAPDFQAIRWSLPEADLRRWAEALQLPSVEALLEQVIVQVRATPALDAADTGYRCPFHSSWAVEGQRDRLKWYQMPGGPRAQRSFALLLSDAAHPFQKSIRYRDPEEMGEWLRVPRHTVRTPSQTLALSYVVRLLHGSSVLKEFPVAFGLHARHPTRLEMIGSPHETTPGVLWGSWQTERQQHVVEIATAQPPRDDRIDIMEFLLPPGAIPDGYFEHTRTNTSDYRGAVPIDSAEQVLRTSGFLLKPPPFDDLLTAVLPPMNVDAPRLEDLYPDDEWEKDPSGVPLRRKGQAAALPRVQVALRVARPGPTGLLGDAILSVFKEMLVQGTLFQEDGPNRWVTPPHAAAASVILRRGDLIVGLVGQNNRESTRDAIRQLTPHVEDHIERVQQRGKNPS